MPTAPASRQAGFGFNGNYMDIEPMAAPHQHLDIEIDFILEGGAEYTIANKHIRLIPGHLLIFWSTIPHQVKRFEPETKGCYLHLPIMEFFHWNLKSDLVARVSSCETVLIESGRYYELDRNLFKLWVEDFLSPGFKNSLAVRRQLMNEIEYRFRRVEPDAINAMPTVLNGPVPDVVIEMAKCIASDCCAPCFTVQTVAQQVELNERYAMTLFKKSLGMTIHEFILRHRVAHAQYLLATTDQTVLAVGLESGFGSQSSFYAAFKRYAKLAPADYREQLHSSN
ncbi:helix-turn-helix domain-containing protein [Mucisphaera calidilacus]|uniref:Melibiose operon regulatory protein n=1 Tax=Mucisphaera calidilacus TaxID=2527982 RepID=A0A518C089_9BACT|nr:helix-turn-helix domain-containing protein [Mucisphaera calidilacus]QDU72641.1 Melibiose operon regulatory protein [Mucisphaera calidilacus]